MVPSVVLGGLKKYDIATEWCCDEYAYGCRTSGSTELAETFLTIHRSAESFGLYLNTFARFSTLDRIDRLAKNETQGKESVMKKSFVVLTLFIVFSCAVVKPQWVAITLAETEFPVKQESTYEAIPQINQPVYEPANPDRTVSNGVVLAQEKSADMIQRELDVVQAEHSLELAESEVKKTIELDYAQAAYGVAAAEVERSETVNKTTPHTVPENELLKQKLKKELALKWVEQISYDLNVRKPKLVDYHKKRLELAKAVLLEKQGGVIAVEKTPNKLRVAFALASLDLAKIDAHDTTKVEYAKALYQDAHCDVERNAAINGNSPGTIPDQIIAETLLIL